MARPIAQSGPTRTPPTWGSPSSPFFPYFLYLVLTELKIPHATWGKRRAGLAVAGPDGEPPSGGRIVIRNLVKVLPWQLGHMGTLRLATSTEVSTAAISLQVASLTILVLVVGPILFGRRGLHDVMAGTRVVSAKAIS